MKILFIGAADHANFGHNYANAINKYVEGWNAQTIVFEPHPFFPNQNVRAISSLTKEDCNLDPGDWVFFLGCGRHDLCMAALANLNPNWFQDYRTAIRHPGSYFRDNTTVALGIDDDLAIRCRFMHPELYHRCKTDPRTFAYLHMHQEGVPYELEKHPDFPQVFHCPTNQMTKGTHYVLKNVDGRVVMKHKLTNEALRDLRATAHYHVDQFNPDLQSFGSAAIESSIYGCVPILNPLGSSTISALRSMDVSHPPFVFCEPWEILENIDSQTKWRAQALACKAWSELHTQPHIRAKHLVSVLEHCK
jgi:hypothetical protein